MNILVKILTILPLFIFVSCTTVDFHLQDKSEIRHLSQRKLRLLMLSSAQIGCPITEIKIRNYLTSGLLSESWLATCKEKKFYCAYAHVQATCTAELLP